MSQRGTHRESDGALGCGGKTKSGETDRAHKHAQMQHKAGAYFDSWWRSTASASRRRMRALVSPEKYPELIEQYNRLVRQELAVRELLIRAVIKLGETVTASSGEPEEWRLTLPAIGDDKDSYVLRVKGMDYNAPSELVVQRTPLKEEDGKDAEEKVNTDG